MNRTLTLTLYPLVETPTGKARPICRVDTCGAYATVSIQDTNFRTPEPYCSPDALGVIDYVLWETEQEP